MPIWRLLPYDTAHPCWEASSHKDSALVRAPDEETARAAAAEAFRVDPDRLAEAGSDPLPCPWEHREYVKAEPTRDTRWPADGPVAVLDPFLPDGAAAGRRLEDVR